MRLKFQYTLFIPIFIILIPRSFWGIWAIFDKTDSLKIFIKKTANKSPNLVASMIWIYLTSKEHIELQICDLVSF